MKLDIFGHSGSSGKMTGLKREVEETMVMETGGKETSAREANARRELNGATKANVANEGTVAIVKIVREEIEVIEKGEASSLAVQIRVLMFLQLCVIKHKQG